MRRAAFWLRALIAIARRAAPWLAAGIIIPLLWLFVASLIFLRARGLWDHPAIPTTSYWHQWATYFSAARRSSQTNLWLAASALAAGAIVGGPVVAIARHHWKRVGGLRGLAQRRLGAERLKLGTTLNHGEARFMTEAEMGAMFPSFPAPKYGGVVVGECLRVDETSVAKLAFDPRDRSTWGLGGRAKLMYDHCVRGSTHSIIVAGSGGFKTTVLATTILNWLASAIVFDPACELYDMLSHAIEQSGRKVARITLGEEGMNVLASMDPNDPLMPVKMVRLVASIQGPIPQGGDGNASRFKEWARDIITTILVHIVCTEDLAPEDRSLSIMRYGLMEGGMEGLKERLRDIAAASPSPYARRMAGGFKGWADEQFSGAYGSATGDTEWLEHDVLSSTVAGSGFNPADLLDGNTVVFVQIQRDVLMERPAVGRAVMGALLGNVADARGQIKNERVGIFVDEAALLQDLNVLRIVRDLGRKEGMTMQLYYQSERQIEEAWGRGWEAWLDGVSWISYGVMGSKTTAESLSVRLGQRAVQATSNGTNTGASGRPMEFVKNKSTGDSENTHEQARPLLFPHEILQEVRTDERLTLVAARRPMRHGAAIGFRRPEIARQLTETTYSAAWEPTNAEAQDA